MTGPLATPIRLKRSKITAECDRANNDVPMKRAGIDNYNRRIAALAHMMSVGALVTGVFR